jgi:hypothetical protein
MGRGVLNSLWRMASHSAKKETVFQHNELPGVLSSEGLWLWRSSLASHTLSLRRVWLPKERVWLARHAVAH